RRHTRSKRDWSSDVCSSDLRIGKDFGISLENDGPLPSALNLALMQQRDCLRDTGTGKTNLLTDRPGLHNAVVKKRQNHVSITECQRAGAIAGSRVRKAVSRLGESGIPRS